MTFNQLYKAMIALDAEEKIKLNQASLFGNLNRKARIEINKDLLDKIPKNSVEIDDEAFSELFF